MEERQASPAACSAQVDHEHLRVWKDGTGFFGFFDTIDDDDVGRALIEEAASWLRGRGMKRMMGPFSLYVNEEVGVLIDGFDTPPVLMMAHSRKYQAKIRRRVRPPPRRRISSPGATARTSASPTAS